MATTLVVAFFVAHEFLHAAIWLPRPESREASAPFAPDRSVLLVAASVPRTTARLLAAALALGTGAAYLLTGLATSADAAWTPAAATAAALLGLLLKLTFFNRWLSLGIALDAAVLSSSSLVGRTWCWRQARRLSSTRRCRTGSAVPERSQLRC